MAFSEQGAARHLLTSTVAFGASLALAAYVAGTSNSLNLMGLSGDGFWADRELRWTALSSALAIAVGVLVSRGARSRAPERRASRTGTLVFGISLAILVCAAWFMVGLFYAPLVAPAHVFAGIRLFLAWQRRRVERAWERAQ